MTRCLVVTGDKVSGITVTALHSHLVDESPHLSYRHFRADGPLADVLRGLRAALDSARTP